MKRFEVYKNIRKRAVIFGLPISLFALLMCVVICSLLVLIFSFSFALVIGVFFANAVLYFALTRIASKALLLPFKSSFPSLISNKRNSNLNYGND